MGIHKHHEGKSQRICEQSGVRLLLSAVIVQAMNDCDYLCSVGEDDYHIACNRGTMGFDALDWFIETPDIIEAFVSWQTEISPEAVRETLRKHLDPIRAEHEERAKEAATRKAYKQKYRKNDPMNVFRKEWNKTLGTVQR